VPGDAKALAVLDLDQDGWPDFFISRNNNATLAFHNRGVAGRRSLCVQLRGPAGIRPPWARASRPNWPMERARPARSAPDPGAIANRLRPASSVTPTPIRRERPDPLAGRPTRITQCRPAPPTSSCGPKVRWPQAPLWAHLPIDHRADSFSETLRRWGGLHGRHSSDSAGMNPGPPASGDAPAPLSPHQPSLDPCVAGNDLSGVNASTASRL